MIPKIVYKPEPSSLKFCSETGNPLPPSIAHWLEWISESGNARHLSLISDSFPDTANLCKLFEAAPAMKFALELILDSVSLEQAKASAKAGLKFLEGV